MAMDTKQLYQISKYAYGESFYESQMSMSGSNQAQILERLEKDQDHIKNQALTIKIILVFYFIFMVVTPIFAFDTMKQSLAAGVDPTWVAIVGCIFFASFFVLQTLLLTIMNLFFAAGVLSGEGFIWLTTLPLERKEIQKVIFFTLFRGLDAPIIAMACVFPLGTAIFTQNVGVTLLALGVSFLNILFTISVLTIVAQRVHEIFKKDHDNSKKGALLRIGVLIAYMVLLMSGVITMQFITEWIGPLYSRPPPENLDVLIIILGLIPFPLNGAILISGTYTGIFSGSNLWVLVLLGSVIYIRVIGSLFKRCLKRLQNVTALQTFQPPSSMKEVITINDIHVQITHPPVNAFFKKEKSAASRDFQLIIWFIIPYIYAILAMTMALDEDPDFFLYVFYLILSSLFIAAGVLRTDGDGATVNVALPIIGRDQAAAKFRWFYIILCTAYLLPTVIVPRLFAPTIVFLAFGPLSAIFFFLLKVRMFGKLRYKYVLEEIHKDYFALKWVVLIGAMLIIAIGLMIGSELLLAEGGVGLLALVLLPIEFLVGGSLYLWFNYMFPRSGNLMHSPPTPT